MTSAEDAKIAATLSTVVDTLKLADTELPPEEVTSGAKRRSRGFVAEDHSELASLSLVRDDGVLRFIYQSPVRGVSSRRARRVALRPVGGNTLHEFRFKEIPPNEMIAALEALDAKLTPNQGLRALEFQTDELAPVKNNFRAQGRTLLLVHGTFSKSNMYIDEFKATPAGQQLLAQAKQKYQHILAFDHPTLSVSPWINALDLEFALAGVEGPFDVVCHSRGGLVVAWWLRNAKREVDNVVFVGSPLMGTNLASPAALRRTLQGMVNLLHGLEVAGALASTVMPLAAIVTGLAKIVGGVVQLGASTPILDAAIITIPGLAAQSRVGNNAEILRLHHAQWISRPRLHAVVSNFEPAEGDSAWRQIIKLFRNPKDMLLNRAADAIFPSENDLVVDTESMLNVVDAPIASLVNFGTSPLVHHLNYFRQPETLTLIQGL